jgi:hypothetical protein
MSSHSREAGVAIGPILFVIALLGVLAVYMSSGNSNMGGAAREDTITTLLHSQANLIRSKMAECNMIRGGWPAGDGSGTAVTALTCPGDPSGKESLWTDTRPSQLAPPPQNFGAWTYFDYSGTGGGRCVRIAPSSGASEPAVRNGIRRAFGKFTTQEADYQTAGSVQSFVIWITRPSGSAGANCVAG